jgi:hypothetical protein
MLHKNRRVLWLLNHRTLMQYEVPLIQRLGFEVYVPKVIPQFGFRSGHVDDSFDSALTIPHRALEALNDFNFYESDWTPRITTLVNRYFGSAFVIPQGQLVAQAVDNFEGQLILRAFGLNNDNTYSQFLEDLHGPLVLRKIKGIRDRFWFGEGYAHLHECEDPFYLERSLFLPIGVPDSTFQHADRWVGTDPRILFVCPNAVSDPYYSQVYRRFKLDFGDLPHVIVGAQDVAVDDPHMLGFVSDEELQRLYRECAVMYYHSTEMRHVHYSPVEAAITGMPIVFMRGSLLDRLSDGNTLGGAADTSEARRLVERLLAGDADLVTRVVSEQRGISRAFSDDYCSAQWRRSFDERGLMDALRRRSLLATATTEARRTLLSPWARGRTRIDPHREAVRPPEATLGAQEATDLFGCSLYDGIDFSARRMPAFVQYVSGVGPAEPWGRWTNNRSIQVVLGHQLSGNVRVFVRAAAYGPNADTPIPVTIGHETRELRLTSDADRPTSIYLHFTIERPSNVIEIRVPHLVQPPFDTRSVGIALMEIRASDAVTMTADEALARYGSSLLQGIDFRAPDLPSFVDAADGLSEPEGWGRWSIGPRVRFELRHVLHGDVRLMIEAVCYGPNVESGVFVSLGPHRARLELPTDPALGHAVAMSFHLEQPTNVLEFEIPHPTMPPGDNRAIGIGFAGIHVEPVTA